jgi:hypothetical protein
MLRHRRGIGHVYGNDCCGPSEENAVKRPSSQEKRRQRIDGKRLDLYLKMWMHCGYVALHRCPSRGQIAYSMGVNECNGDLSSTDTERDQGATPPFTAIATGEILLLSFAMPEASS